MSGLDRLFYPVRHKRRGHKSQKSREWRESRRERRKEKRREKRAAQRRAPQPQLIKVVTWNIQRTSVRHQNRHRLKRFADYITQQKWEIVLISELNADQEGIIWLGGATDPIALIHSQRAGVFLRGSLLEKWTNQGQKKWLSERTAAVVVDNMRLVAVYQPVWSGGQGQESIEQYRAEVEEQIGRSNGGEILIIGGDHNAHTGTNDQRPGVTGRFGLRHSNEAGVDLINWCESNGLAWVNSFYNHKQRGTWFNQIYGRWYELDGFIMRASQRHKFAKKIATINEHAMSDHKPKMLYLRPFRPWRHSGAPKRKPQLRWERLQNEETAGAYKEATRTAMERAREEGRFKEDSTNWDILTDLMVRCVRELCGTRERRMNNPWMAGREEEDEHMKRIINDLIIRRNSLLEGPRTRTRDRDITQTREELKRARKDHKRARRRWEREWWNLRIDECEDAFRNGNMGQMYRILREIGQGMSNTAPPSHTISTDEFRDHFSALSANRFENPPREMELVLEKTKDLRSTPMAIELNEFLNEVPDEEEIYKEMKKVKDSAPGEDGVRMRYIAQADVEIQREVTKMVQFMFQNDPQEWEQSLKVGHMIPIYKKGDRDDRGNYRGVVLLAMGSRILARIVASRARWWAEKLGLMDENQAGFREGRSTADATQLLTRIQEDVADYRKRRELQPQRAMAEEEIRVQARLLDLEKAYPRVNRPCLWGLLRRYGLGGNFLNSIMALHETTEYKVKGAQDVSSPWTPQRGLREGCPTSPILFNIFHQAVMRVAEEEREQKGRDEGRGVGIEWNYMPGSNFPGRSLWEKFSSETKTVRLTSSLFADDTTILGEEGEMAEGVEVVKRTMASFEEKNNDSKEETLHFGDLNEETTRMLGCWMGAKEDVQRRKARAGKAWFQVKKQLHGSTLPKRTQARIVEACVESALLFDCNTRVWYVREIKSLQSWMDRCYRRIWGGGTGPPLIRMQQQRVNMFDVRERLGIKSIRWKIEKRTLERIGHVMRMDNSRLVKIAILGWFRELETWNKCPGKKRKTQLYWIKTLKDAGIDWTQVELLAQDRKAWKSLITNRMKHLQRYEQQQGHKYEWEENEQPLTRNNRPDPTEDTEGFRCNYEGCEKICISKAGLTIHQRRMHQAPRKIFVCDKCAQTFKSENTWKNHSKRCTGGTSSRPNYTTCTTCNREYSKNNIARHRRSCEARAGVAGRRDEGGGEEEDEEEPPDPSLAPRVYVARRGECDLCGRNLSLTNMARHKKTCSQRL